MFHLEGVFGAGVGAGEVKAGAAELARRRRLAVVERVLEGYSSREGAAFLGAGPSAASTLGWRACGPQTQRSAGRRWKPSRSSAAPPSSRAARRGEAKRGEDGTWLGREVTVPLRFCRRAVDPSWLGRVDLAAFGRGASTPTAGPPGLRARRYSPPQPATRAREQDPARRWHAGLAAGLAAPAKKSLALRGGRFERRTAASSRGPVLSPRRRTLPWRGNDPLFSARGGVAAPAWRGHCALGGKAAATRVNPSENSWLPARACPLNPGRLVPRSPTRWSSSGATSRMDAWPTLCSGRCSTWNSA